ncbi:MAG: alpha/beta hydrolase, partial [Candidatus Omnitrophica bacterium]|nr:alpha/beta hydrolase [Candidatus Omnitrophota bacterium]
MPSVKLDDIPLYYEVYGKGSPLLLIGGLGSDSASWLGVAKGFSPYFQAIVFDNRGSGRSGLGHQECTIGRMAQDAAGLLDLLKIERAHIIGHSMGGYMAQEIAINYPGRIDKLVLESTAPVSSERNNALFKDFYDQLVKEGCSE